MPNIIKLLKCKDINNYNYIFIQNNFYIQFTHIVRTSIFNAYKAFGHCNILKNKLKYNRLLQHHKGLNKGKYNTTNKEVFKR